MAEEIVIGVPTPSTEKLKNFITTYESIGGWKAVMYWWNPDMGGFWEPWDMGLERYQDEAKAIEEAQTWAESEGLEYVPRQKSKKEIINHWLTTGEILSPAKGDATYIGFPSTSEKEGAQLAKDTNTVFMMGEFVKRFA